MGPWLSAKARPRLSVRPVSKVAAVRTDFCFWRIMPSFSWEWMLNKIQAGFSPDKPGDPKIEKRLLKIV
jgi:hypothetical protein